MIIQTAEEFIKNEVQPMLKKISAKVKNDFFVMIHRNYPRMVQMYHEMPEMSAEQFSNVIRAYLEFLEVVTEAFKHVPKNDMRTPQAQPTIDQTEK